MKIDKLFDVNSLHKPKDGKRISGDFAYYEILEKESLVVCALADGVSTRRDDWWASKTACTTFVNHIIKNIDDIEIRIKDAIKSAHNEVKDPNDPYKGPACSMAAIVWNYEENKFYFVNAGDTRVYHLMSNELIKLTEDDTEPMRINPKGMPQLTYSSPLFFEGMVKIIGQPSNIEVDVCSREFNAGESIILLSDGVHKKGGLLSQISNVVSSDDIEHSLNKFIDECIENVEDDASIIIIRRNDFKEDDLITFEKALCGELDLTNNVRSNHLFNKFILSKLDIALSDKDLLRTERYLNIILENSLDVNKDRMVNMFGKYCDFRIENVNIYNSFVAIIRRATSKK